MLSVDDYRQAARERLTAQAWDYFDGGSGTERTLDANCRAFDEVVLRPRVLVDVSDCPTRTTVLGCEVALPVAVAPTAYHRMAHPDGEVATARGAGAAGALYVVSMLASRTLEEVAQAATGPLWLQLYWLRRREVLAGLAERAAAAGFRALVLTVDTPRIGLRLRDLRNNFALDPAIAAANVPAEIMATMHQRRPGSSALARHADEAFDPSVTWADLAWLRKVSPLPLLLKGIVTAEDATRAVEYGVAGVIVSNHGGRQLDGVAAALHALPEVAGAVNGACPVLFDGGVRRGTDVFAALALGAQAVLVGRPVLWALAAAGGDGVADLLRLLRDELAHTMALAGRPTLSGIDRSAVAGRTGLGPVLA
ncbi:MAG TPA: alpha-hydroxy acid oxidase [Micromonosporaceae bacterium]|nr:alpha-hydroxy acid oxidase [Micromonosporaceae bacterium]